MSSHDIDRLNEIRRSLASASPAKSSWHDIARLRSEALSIISRLSPQLGASLRRQVTEPAWVEPEPAELMDTLGGPAARHREMERLARANSANLRLALSARSDFLGLLDDALRTIPTQQDVAASNVEADKKQPTESGHEVVGRWRLLSHLKGAKGYQGDTHLVEASNPYAAGVLKRLKERDWEEGDRDKAIARLQREIDLTQALNHPCILPVLDMGTDEKGDPWVVTEYMKQGSLHDSLAFLRGDVWRSLRLARDVASALAVAHGRKVVHRDIKPQNILLRSFNEAVLGDFGIAHAADATRLTDTGDRPVGAQWFRPPEADKGRLDDPRPSFDVYSLGKVIYVSISGGPRFPREHFADAEHDLCTLVEHPRTKDVNDVLLSKMIVENPKERFQTMGEVIVAIDRVLAGRGAVQQEAAG